MCRQSAGDPSRLPRPMFARVGVAAVRPDLPTSRLVVLYRRSGGQRVLTPGMTCGLQAVGIGLSELA